MLKFSMNLSVGFCSIGLQMRWILYIFNC